MTVLSAALALFVAIGPAWTAAILLFSSLIGLHVIGNALGTRLRQQRSQGTTAASVEEVDRTQEPLATLTIVPAKRLQERTGLRRPWLVAAAVSAMASGALGGIVIAALVGKSLTIPGLALGIGSTAVLGGFFGFMACSLWTVARTALREALEASEPDPPSVS